jgi:hypothetical protein
MKRSYNHGHWFGWFYDETWRANIEVLWPVDGKAVSAHIKRRHGTIYKTDDDFSAKCVEVIDGDGADTNIICLRWWPKKPRPTHYAMLAHEAFHAAEHILSNRGVSLVPGTTEPYAYLIEGIVRRSLLLADTGKKLEP